MIGITLSLDDFRAGVIVSMRISILVKSETRSREGNSQHQSCLSSGLHLSEKLKKQKTFIYATVILVAFVTKQIRDK